MHRRQCSARDTGAPRKVMSRRLWCSRRRWCLLDSAAKEPVVLLETVVSGRLLCSRRWWCSDSGAEETVVSSTQYFRGDRCARDSVALEESHVQKTVMFEDTVVLQEATILNKHCCSRRQWTQDSGFQEPMVLSRQICSRRLWCSRR